MSVKHILLGILSWEANSGYGIKTEVEHSGRELGWGRISFGSIYPQWKTLEGEGLIEAVETEAEGRRTKIYDLTAKGWKELSDWLEQPPGPPELRDELFMKMSFWEAGKPEDRETLIDHLEIRRGETENMLESFEEWISNDYSAIGEIAGIGMDYQIDRMKLDLKWYDRIIDQLRKPSSAPRQDPRGLFEKAEKRKEDALRREE